MAERIQAVERNLGILGEAAPSRPIRPWWVQTEMLQVLLLLAAHEEDGEAIAREFDELSRVVRLEFIDERHGGWFPRARSDWRLGARLRPARVHKGNRWKDSSHESDLYLTGIRVLRGLEAGAPLA